MFYCLLHCSVVYPSVLIYHVLNCVELYFNMYKLLVYIVHNSPLISQVFDIPSGQFHVTTDTTQKNKTLYAEYLVLLLHCTHITCHGFKGNIQIQLNNYEISPFEQLCEKLPFFTLKITHSLAPIIMKY